MIKNSFELAGAELDWPLVSAAGMTNHPDIEVVASRLEHLLGIGLSVVTVGSWTLGDVRPGNAYTQTGVGWENLGGDEYLDIETRAGYNSKGLPNPGTDIAMERIPDLVELANSKGVELALSLSPHSGSPVEELKEIVALSAKALSDGALYVEVNLGCPNVQGRPAFYLDLDGLSDLNEYIHNQELLLNKNGHPGLYLKYGPLSPAQIDPKVHLANVRSVGGRVTSNTLGNQVPVNSDGEQMIGVNEGKAGMSGPSLKELGREQLNLWINALLEAGTISEVVSVMGIDSGEEVIKRLRIGAAAVQLGSILYWPELVGLEDAGDVVEMVKSGIVGGVK